jgi:6-phosphogluconolactonase (cycloisomerase 2 family)
MQRSRIRFLTYLAALAGGSLAGCGGGSGGDDGAGPAGPAPTPPSPPPAAEVRTFAYAATTTSREIAIFRVGEDGMLSPAGTVAGERVDKVVIHPSGKFAYGVSGGDTVRAYSVDQNTGMLSFIDSVGTGVGPEIMVIHPSGKLAFVSNIGDDSVSIFAVLDDGTLQPNGIFPVSDQPSSIAVHPSGGFLLVGGGRAITSYAIAANGDLTLADTVVGTVVPFHVAISPNGSFVYVLNNDNSISIHAVDSFTGALEPPTTLGGIGLGGAMIFSADGLFAYLPLPGGVAIIVFSVLPDGTLTIEQVLQPVPAPSAIATEPSGKALYAIDDVDSSLSTYRIEAGRLALEGTPITLSSAASGITVASFTL